MARRSPTVRRRRLGQELRALREAKALTVEHVAKELDWSPSKVSRIETTPIKVGMVDLRALLDVYEVADKERREGLLELGRESREPAWWLQINEKTPIRDFKNFIGFEAEARRIRTYEPAIMPGLLQTEEYARAMIKVMLEDAGADIDEAVKLRMERQEILTRPDDPVQYTAFIDEAAFHRPAGGERRAIVMFEQIEKLINASRRANINIFVVPFKSGLHPGMNGAFTVLDLPHQKDPDVVYVEAITHAVVLDDLENVSYYNDKLDGIRAEAYGRDDTDAFLREWRDRFRTELGS